MENKLVTYKHLTVGQEIKGTEDGCYRRSFSAIVKSINPAYVTVEMWRRGGDDVIFHIEYKLRQPRTLITP